MNKKLNLLVSSAIIALTFSTPQAIQGTESLSTPNESKKPSGIQLKELADGSLEAILGSGNDILLKISMDLTSLKEPVEQERLEVPVQLFLTDFGSSPTSDTPVRLSINVDCEWTPLACVLPKKPASFDSYGQFTDWLNQGYFTNENRIAYDFDVDVQQLAPSLAQHLYAVVPGGYHFVGTYAVHNGKIMPDECVPNIAYSPQRGNMNSTIVTLGGTFYLNNCSYPIVGHQQIFPYPMIEEIVFKTNIEDLKKQLEVTQREVCDLRQAREEEIAKKRVKEAAERERIQAQLEAERQRIQRERAAEAERQRIRERQEAEQRQREVQAKLELVSTSIDRTIQHIKDLQNYNLTYGELVKVLDAMDEYYRREGREEAKNQWCEEITQRYRLGTYENFIEGVYDIMHSLRAWSDLPKASVHGRYHGVSLIILHRDVKEKMEKYRTLCNQPHHRWNEFGDM